MGEGIEDASVQPDIAIEIARESNGSLFVLPALTA